MRSENLDSWYLGQETYVRVVNPEVTNKTELPIPDNALFCGALKKMQKYVLMPSISKSYLLRIVSEFITFAFSGHKISLQHHQSSVIDQNHS